MTDRILVDELVLNCSGDLGVQHEVCSQAEIGTVIQQHFGDKSCVPTRCTSA